MHILWRTHKNRAPGIRAGYFKRHMLINQRVDTRKAYDGKHTYNETYIKPLDCKGVPYSVIELHERTSSSLFQTAEVDE